MKFALIFLLTFFTGHMYASTGIPVDKIEFDLQGPLSQATKQEGPTCYSHALYNLWHYHFENSAVSPESFKFVELLIRVNESRFTPAYWSSSTFKVEGSNITNILDFLMNFRHSDVLMECLYNGELRPLTVESSSYSTERDPESFSHQTLKLEPHKRILTCLKNMNVQLESENFSLPLYHEYQANEVMFAEKYANQRSWVSQINFETYGDNEHPETMDRWERQRLDNFLRARPEAPYIISIYNPWGNGGKHALTVTGWELNQGRVFLKLKNSWGPNWCQTLTLDCENTSNGSVWMELEKISNQIFFASQMSVKRVRNQE